ncbi:acetyl-CoA carboxylase carboxyltransferase subunit alpha [Tumebacillus sp. DT12]|uniref:Acetyl-coenzyme A carboxylase carboxyl transferase subunit alpha n=1 Tax=Tumebacillus lacus TaxID=2995335 RepID=A0ABT3X1A1_9BACL|nr:acetyl-CoA carboxylase carboxyltransferase subunit alpha [Tumebacillus lacus]MCX7570673.1 acetyl-CoA carboxylase carboxyltransferase subunit alpha [Tumebacillus lacus]
MANELMFEKPLLELQKKIQELRTFSQQSGLDFSEEIDKLEKKAELLASNIYEDLTPWQRTQLARHSERPTTLDYIAGICTHFVELHGDRNFGDDLAIVGGIGKIDGIPVTVIGHQKGHDTKENIARRFGMPQPEGYRKALRLMKQAEKFKRPVICFIDTPGAYPGIASEERGIGEAIARNLIEMAGLRTPIICVVTGEGGSGGALALGVGDRVYMLENSIYGVISPEGAAALLWKDSSLGQRAAETMKITAGHIHSFGVVDGVIPEPQGGAHKDTAETIAAVKETIVAALRELIEIPSDLLVEQRYNKYKQMGHYAEL